MVLRCNRPMLQLTLPFKSSNWECTLVEFTYLVLTRMTGRFTVSYSGLCSHVPCLSSAIISLCQVKITMWFMDSDLWLLLPSADETIQPFTQLSIWMENHSRGYYRVVSPVRIPQPLTQWSQSGLTMLFRHSVEMYKANELAHNSSRKCSSTAPWATMDWSWTEYRTVEWNQRVHADLHLYIYIEL